MRKFKIKRLFPYEIMLSETGAAPIEAIAMVCLIRYLKRMEQMGEGIWPKVSFNEGMSERKKSWMRQNNKWMQKWNIYLNACPTNSKELNNFVMENFVNIYGERSWVERRSTMLRNSTPLVISNKKNTMELAFRGGQRFL